MAISVVIADDQMLVRSGFAMVINSQPDMEVVGQASDGAQAVALVDKLHPDIVLMDVRMPRMDGIEATGKIAALDDAYHSCAAKSASRGTSTADSSGSHSTAAPDASPIHHTRVIILTTFDLDEYVLSAIREGASGFLLKDTSPEQMLDSLRQVYAGNAIIAPSATRRLISRLAQGPQVKGPQAQAHQTQGTQIISTAQTPTLSREQKEREEILESLTQREILILKEVAHGLSNQEIADKLFISVPTVKTHIGHILAKTGSRDRVQAVVFAYESGLVS